MKNLTNCTCGLNKSYEQCCKQAHDNIKTVKTAEALMRSRYAAFTKANGAYLKMSQHSSTQPKTKREINDIQQWASSVQWVRLEVLKSVKGLQTDTEGTVEFKAYFIEEGLPNCIHEKSRFVKENGHWVYLDGMNF